MTHRRFSLPLALLCVGLAAFPVHALDSTWVALEVPLAQEPAAVAGLESGGLFVLSWSNALVEVSDFDAPELRPLATLEATLTAWDPRWDPWLTGLKPVFQPREGVARLFVSAADRDQALRLLGPLVSETTPTATTDGIPPRLITGLLLASLAALFLVFRGWAELRSRPSGPRRWLWLALSLAVVAAGATLAVGGGARSSAGQTVVAPASWLRHLWFQQAFPFGARWDDWVPGKSWSYPTYARRDGRIVESLTALPSADEAWAKAARAGLGTHQVARLFPPENP